jgi:hypothetical protein
MTCTGVVLLPSASIPLFFVGFLVPGIGDYLVYIFMHQGYIILWRTLTLKGLRVFLLKIASKQPLLKASGIVQNWNQFWYFQL